MKPFAQSQSVVGPMFINICYKNVKVCIFTENNPEITSITSWCTVYNTKEIIEVNNNKNDIIQLEKLYIYFRI